MSADPLMLLGIDGGATNVRAALATQDGTIRGLGRAGAASYSSSGAGAAEQQLQRAIDEACARAGVKRPKVAGFVGLAGVVTDADRSAVVALARRVASVEWAAVAADHDIRIALAGGLAGGEGIALISGTGSSCYGRNAAGQTWQAGGWERLVDDAGAGYDIALRGLRAAVRAADGRGPETALTGKLFAALHIDALPQIIDRLHVGGLDGLGRPPGKEDIARLAPLVFELAEAGDAVAGAILDAAADELALMIAVVAEKLRWNCSEIPAITAGSVAHNPQMADRLERALAARAPGVRLSPPICDPTAGAVLLAGELAGVKITPTWVEKLRQTLQWALEARAST